MINNSLFFTYLYLLIYILLSSGVILYNKVIPKFKALLYDTSLLAAEDIYIYIAYA